MSYLKVDRGNLRKFAELRMTTFTDFLIVTGFVGFVDGIFFSGGRGGRGTFIRNSQKFVVLPMRHPGISGHHWAGEPGMF